MGAGVLVPGTSANLGPGFDSFGLALDVFGMGVDRAVEAQILGGLAKAFAAAGMGHQPAQARREARALHAQEFIARILDHAAGGADITRAGEADRPQDGLNDFLADAGTFHFARQVVARTPARLPLTADSHLV